MKFATTIPQNPSTFIPKLTQSLDYLGIFYQNLLKIRGSGWWLLLPHPLHLGFYFIMGYH
jgi:hypothetical protein